MSHEKRSPIPLYGNLTPAPDGFLKLRKRSLLERIPYVKDLYQAQIRDLEEQLDRASYVSREVLDMEINYRGPKHLR